MVILIMLLSISLNFENSFILGQTKWYNVLINAFSKLFDHLINKN
jgi:hypothetical protein